jgi:hypothetical protein
LAERLDEVNPAPARDPLSQPQQRLFATVAPAQRLGGQRPEPVRQQADGLDQREESPGLADAAAERIRTG